MWLRNWLRSSQRRAAPSPRPARRSKAPTTRLFLEPLEDRTLLSGGWAISNGGTGTLGTVQEISAPDAASNLYVTGYFSGTATFGSTTLNAPTVSSYVAKVDPNGNFLWATQIGGAASSTIPAIAVDTSGNVYATGNFAGTASFGSTTLTSDGGTNADVYICKLDSNGNVLWAKQAGGSSGDDPTALATDSSGNVYVTGMFDHGGSATVSATFGRTTLTATCCNVQGEAPIFLSKLDTNGNFLWSEQLLGGIYGQPSGIAGDSSGNMYIVGGAAGFQGSSNSGFIERVDPSGNVIWAQGTSRPILGDAIYQNPTTGANWLYTGVWPTTSMPTDVQKIDAASGTVLWSEQIGSSVSVRPFALAVDASGNLYLTGSFGGDYGPGTLDFDPGPGVATLTAQATGYNSEVFVVKLDPSGSFLSVHSFGGPTAGNDGRCVVVDSGGNIYTAGSFGGTSNFDTGSQIVSLASSGSASLYLVKTTQDTGMIFGQVFNDLNNSGIPNVTVYLDLNNSGSLAAGDPTATTDSQGYFHLSDVVPGSYTLRQIVPSGYSGSPGAYTFSVTAGQASETAGFADYNYTNSPKYVVTSTADDGSAGTLRDAINQANASGGAITEIDFHIGTAGSSQTISLTSPLPALTANAVFINGLSQGGSGNTRQMITLDGTKAGSSSDGLLLQGSNDIVSGLIIQHFGNNGIEVVGSGNTIGGSTQGARNIISGNSEDGVLIDSGSSGNQVLGNFLGLKNTGYSALANGANGLEVKGSNNTIGGAIYYDRNYLSGNANAGLLLDNGASGNLVLGNFIGLDLSGTHGVGNLNGIEIAGTSNTLGGTSVFGTNYISGNNNDGILLDGTASANLIQGTDVGTDYAGSASVGNSGNGIEVMGNGNTLGSTTSAARNILSGNSLDGVRIDSGVSGTLIQGNFIGLNAIDAPSPNAGNGINIAGANNTIGGTATGARNIISGNSGDGVLLGSSASGNVVLGNFLGVNLFSNAAANHNGIEVAGTQNTIGGSASGAFNVLSGNTSDGVLLDNTASGNVVLGNNVGLNVYGTVAVGNSNGIEVAGTHNTVGASYAVGPNIISGNSKDGVVLDNTASGNQVLGNYIGTNYSGTVALANQVGIEDAGNHNTIGGSVLGARNVISGNTSDGVLYDSSATAETIEGNYIGVNAGGNTALANGSNGIEVQGTGNTIGGNSGTDYFNRNFLSGNGNDGVLFDSSASGNQVLGNFVGVGVNGTKGVGNVANAVEIVGSSNTIGGTVSGNRNVISGSGNDGVRIDSTATNNLLQGNVVGTDYTGKNAVANSGNGIEIQGTGNTVGGSVSGSGNVISGNSKDGVLVSGGSGDTISRNSIFANTGLGISLSSGANNKIAAPSIRSATLNGSMLTVQGSFTAPTANLSYVLEFFANPSGDPEGKVYLGALPVTPATTGTQLLTFTTTTTVTGAYPLITATLTDSGDGTSEFALGIPV